MPSARWKSAKIGNRRSQKTNVAGSTSELGRGGNTGGEREGTGGKGGRGGKEREGSRAAEGVWTQLSTPQGGGRASGGRAGGGGRAGQAADGRAGQAGGERARELPCDLPEGPPGGQGEVA
jgi:hypothetical protein